MKIVHFTFESLSYLTSGDANELLNKIIDGLILNEPDFLSFCGITKDNFQTIVKIMKGKNYTYMKVKELEKEIPENLIFINEGTDFMIEDTLLYKFKKTKENRFLALYKIIRRADFKPQTPLFPVNYPNANNLNKIYKPEPKEPIDNITICITTLDKKLPSYRIEQLNEITEFLHSEKYPIILGNMNICNWQNVGEILETQGWEDAWYINGDLEDKEERFDRIYYYNLPLTKWTYLLEDLYYDETISSYGIEVEFSF